MIALVALPLFGLFDTIFSVLLVGALVVAGLALGVARLRHVLGRRRITARFDEFKERVIGLREQVESLKARHAQVPGGQNADETMSGTTRAVYRQLHEEFGRLLDEWRRRMDLWEKVQGLVAAQGPLGAGRFNEASELLDRLGRFDEVDQACQSCAGLLDRLEKGHEEARARLQTVEARSSQVRPHIARVADLELPTAPYEEEVQRCAALAEEARRIQATDPIGAADALILAEEKLTALTELLDDVVAQYHRCGEVEREAERVRGLVAARRAGGLLLVEPEGDPDPHLAQVSPHCGAALDALRRGEAATARTELDKAISQISYAEELIARQEAAREQCRRDLPARRAAAHQLRQAQQQASGQLHDLERGFAPHLWRNVADHVPQAAERMATSAVLLDEAAEAEARQHYFHAVDLLDQAQKQQKEALELFHAVGSQLQHLVELKRQCSRRAEEVSHLAGRVEGTIDAHRGAVRSRTRSRLEQAQQKWVSAWQALQSDRPDWTAIQRDLEEAARGYNEAENAAREDVRLADRAAAAVAEAERELDRVLGDYQTAGRADLSRPTGLMGQARGLLSSQDYEQAFDQANAAVNEARRARDEALLRLRAEEEEQRRQQALAAAAYVAATAPPPQPAYDAPPQPVYEAPPPPPTMEPTPYTESAPPEIPPSEPPPGSPDAPSPTEETTM